MLPTMFVLLLLLFQPRHTWDTQEGVVGVPIPDQQLLVRGNHLEREIQMGVSGGDGERLPLHPRLVTLDLPWPYSISCQTLLPSGICQWSPAPPRQARHCPGCSTEGDGTAQHHPPPAQTCTGVSPRLGHEQHDRQISSYRAHRRSWGLWSEGLRSPCSSGR